MTKALHELLSGSWIRLFLLKEPAGRPHLRLLADSVRPRDENLQQGWTAPGMNRRAGCVPTPGSSAMQRPDSAASRTHCTIAPTNPPSPFFHFILSHCRPPLTVGEFFAGHPHWQTVDARDVTVTNCRSSDYGRLGKKIDPARTLSSAGSARSVDKRTQLVPS